VVVALRPSYRCEISWENCPSWTTRQHKAIKIAIYTPRAVMRLKGHTNVTLETGNVPKFESFWRNHVSIRPSLMPPPFYFSLFWRERDGKREKEPRAIMIGGAVQVLRTWSCTIATRGPGTRAHGFATSLDSPIGTWRGTPPGSDVMPSTSVICDQASSVRQRRGSLQMSKAGHLGVFFFFVEAGNLDEAPATCSPRGFSAARDIRCG
jgi:hypothetical protein